MTPKPGTPDFSQISPKVTYKVEEVTPYKTGSVSDPQSNCFVLSDKYELDQKTGKFSLISPMKLAYHSYSGGAKTYLSKGTYNITRHGSNVCGHLSDDDYKGYYNIFKVTSAQLSASSNSSPKFTYLLEKSVVDTVDYSTDGVYSMPDDYGTSYYYRGTAYNNYVKFAGFYWRIIRVNGDGTLRVIYDGTTAHENGENSTDRNNIDFNGTYNAKYTDNKHVGFMSINPNSTVSTSLEQAQTNTYNSNAKTKLQNWYVKNIDNKEDAKYVSDNLFCNDRSVASASQTWWNYDTKLGYGSNRTAYGGFQRLVNADGSWKTSNITPTFKCTKKNDVFTLEDTKYGNGHLYRPVGLITIDEAVAAGAVVNIQNPLYYLRNTGYGMWTMTPISFNTYAYQYVLNGEVSIGNQRVDQANYLKPVINLSPEFVKDMTGDGSMTNPFTIE